MAIHPELLSTLGMAGVSVRMRFAAFDGNDEVECSIHPATNGEHHSTGSVWDVSIQTNKIGPGAFHFDLTFRLKQGRIAAGSVSLEFVMSDWSIQNYILFPAAAYNGNRFVATNSHRVEEFPSPSLGMPLTITNQARLAIEAGPSRIDFRSGDMATPGVAVFFAQRRKSFILLTDQKTSVGETGFTFSESLDRSEGSLRICAPCVRPGDYGKLRGDIGAVIEVGEAITLSTVLFVEPCESISELFQHFSERRLSRGSRRLRNDIPFSACWSIQEAKYNEQNWVPEYGYYSVGMRESAAQNWQTAWVGGLNTVYPLLCEGSSETRQRALQTFDFLFSGGQYPSGYLRSCFHEGEWMWVDRPILQRSNADALFFSLKSFLLLEERGVAVQERWKLAVYRLARAFCSTWRSHGQLGHRVNGETGAVVFGGTTSAGIAPAGLALAARYFQEPEFLTIALACADGFARDYLANGITNAGPGDVLQCPDSESAAGLLEGFVTLYEETKDRRWLNHATSAAHHIASWTMSYDFEFPKDSTFGRLDMLTYGTVFANIQNKHSAPGLCTVSGASLLRLFRATGDLSVLELLRAISHAIPQYMSREDRPIADRRPNQRWPIMPPGWINERVNTSDWEQRGNPDQDIGVGEIFGGSTWSEVAMLQTFAEVPGLYLQLDSGLLCVFDHVEAEFDGFHLSIHNPTRFPASLKMFLESTSEASKIFGPLGSLRFSHVNLAPGERKVISVSSINPTQLLQ